MSDITNPKLLYLKGFLFVCVGGLASGLLLADHPNLRTALLLAVSVWAFARAYYFAFYVIEHYIDPGFRYAGLLSAVRHLIGRRAQGRESGRAVE